MKSIWRVRSLSVDGGKIGKTWTEWFYTTEEQAEKKLKGLVDNDNKREMDRTKSPSDQFDKHVARDFENCQKEGRNWWRLHCEDTVEEVKGWAAWAYSHMYTMDEVLIEGEGDSALTITSTDSKFWCDLIDFLDDYPIKDPDSTLIRMH